MRTRAIKVLICLSFTLLCVATQPGCPVQSGLQQSGEGFSVGGHFVHATYGYFGDGDELAFAIIQTWPLNTPPDQRLADRRVDFNSGGTPLILHADGKYYPPDMSGTVYMFFGDELRTMRVKMDEHTDTAALMHVKDLVGIWAHFEKFKTKKQ
jgi:hypothetical protein